MPSDAKKKRDLQKKAAAKQRQAPSGKKASTTNTNDADTNPNDEDLLEDNDDDEIQNENENPTNQSNGAKNEINDAIADVDPNVKSLIQNLDLLSMVEKANADARSCTGVLGSHPRGRDIHIHQFSVTFHGQEILSDADFEMNCGRRYGLVGLNGSGKSTILAAIGNREVKQN
ncbi:unnamed protein product [Rotaria magnacalcarata]|uniref:ABC transporter domain-containing protein n=1 Tax=Rotaria magnacalcarata TaxID=392030 RepID=A0A8S3ID84_9BILA|nr:unnamed protein product [Rotaria magnacalcarata]